jgi:chromosome segregation ATPase
LAVEELNSLDGTQGVRRTDLVECEAELALSKARVERAEEELGELRRRVTTLAERSAELLTQVEVVFVKSKSYSTRCGLKASPSRGTAR